MIITCGIHICNYGYMSLFSANRYEADLATVKMADIFKGLCIICIWSFMIEAHVPVCIKNEGFDNDA